MSRSHPKNTTFSKNLSKARRASHLAWCPMKSQLLGAYDGPDPAFPSSDVTIPSLFTEHLYKDLACACLGSFEWGISASSSEEGQGTKLSFNRGPATLRCEGQRNRNQGAFFSLKDQKSSITRKALQKVIFFPLFVFSLQNSSFPSGCCLRFWATSFKHQLQF